jgi:hypothetical protein
VHPFIIAFRLPRRLMYSSILFFSLFSLCPFILLLFLEQNTFFSSYPMVDGSEGI